MCRLEKEVLGIITNAEYKNMEGRFLTQKNHTEITSDTIWKFNLKD